MWLSVRWSFGRSHLWSRRAKGGGRGKFGPGREETGPLTGGFVETTPMRRGLTGPVGLERTEGPGDECG